MGIATRRIQLRAAQPAAHWAVLGLSIALTLGVCAYVWSVARSRDEARFVQAAHETHNQLQRQFDSYIAIIRSTAGLFAAAEHVRPREFASFINSLNLEENYPGMLGVGHIVRLPPGTPEEHARVLAPFRNSGTPQLSMWPGPREGEERFPILYIEPMDWRNARALGFDMWTDPTRRAAIERARDTGKVTASGTVRLVQETESDTQPGFLIFVPVYAGGTVPGTVEERRQKLVGLAYGAFRLHDVLGAHADDLKPEVDMQVYPGIVTGTPEGPKFASEPVFDSRDKRSAADAGWNAPREAELALRVADRSWRIVYEPRPWLMAASETRSVPLLLGCGLGASGLIFVVTRRQWRARVMAEEAAAALRESESRFRLMADSAPVMIWTAGPDGSATYFNRPWLSFTGRPPEEQLGQGWWQCVHPDDIRNCRTTADEASERRLPFRMEFRLRRADGEYRWVLVHGVPRLNTRNQFAGYIGSCVDIHDRKQTEDELARSNADLQDFAYVASHDLKEPLRGISNYAAFLLEDYAPKLDEAGIEKLRTITRLSARMYMLLDSLLEYSRSGAGELRMEEIELRDITLEVSHALHPRLEFENAELIVHPLPRVRCDRTGVTQVLMNLVTNALKYNTSNRKRIEIGSVAGTSPAAIYVRDNGIGIEPRHHERIFRMFKRLHARDQFGGGSGIGLSIVKKIVERHGGRLWVDSAPGEGTTFYFTLGAEPAGRTGRDSPADRDTANTTRVRRHAVDERSQSPEGGGTSELSRSRLEEFDPGPGGST